MEIGEVIATSAGEIVVIGLLQKPDNTVYDTFILKLSSGGDFQWLKTYGWSYSSFMSEQLIETEDGFAFVRKGAGKVRIVKLDGQGNVATPSKYTSQNTESTADITVDSEGSIVILSKVELPPNNLGTVTLTKLSPSL